MTCYQPDRGGQRHHHRQQNLQSQVATALDQHAPGVLGAAAVVLNPQTGAIEAMYSNPTFDPNPLVSPGPGHGDGGVERQRMSADGESGALRAGQSPRAGHLRASSTPPARRSRWSPRPPCSRTVLTWPP